MKRFLIVGFVLMGLGVNALAGNANRAGEAGASELLINPWARSSGWEGLNTACVKGIESLNLNVAGLAFTQKTEVIFAHSIYLQGSGLSINAFGFSQALGKSGGVIGLDLMSIGFPDIPITTTAAPDGGLGTYKPQFINLALAYSKSFSNSIYCGFAIRGVSEGITNVKATGAAIDAGVQYVTGDKRYKDKIKFGIALRNVGTPMHFSGDALSFKTVAPQTNTGYSITVEQRSEQFELPSLLNIGASYDFHFGKGPVNGKQPNRLTIAANFTSNSFSQDQEGAGLEYAFKEEFMIRVGYNYENNALSDPNRVTSNTGLAVGFTAEVPFTKAGSKFALDYSYRTSNPFGGTHTIGARFNL